MSNIFKHEGDSGKGKRIKPSDGKNDFADAVETIDARQNIKRFIYCHVLTRYCRSKRDRMLYEIGEDRLSRNLDVLTFLKQQMVMNSVLKTLLSPQEKYLIKHQKQFALDSASSSSASEDDINPNTGLLQYQTYAKKLAQGVKQRKKSLMTSYGGKESPKKKAHIHNVESLYGTLQRSKTQKL